MKYSLSFYCSATITDKTIMSWERSKMHNSCVVLQRSTETGVAGPNGQGAALVVDLEGLRCVEGTAQLLLQPTVDWPAKVRLSRTEGAVKLLAVSKINIRYQVTDGMVTHFSEFKRKPGYPDPVHLFLTPKIIIQSILLLWWIVSQLLIIAWLYLCKYATVIFSF